MKIEFLENGSGDCPLIRLYGDEPDVCQHLVRAFDQLGQGMMKELALSDLPGIEPINGCWLVAKAGRWDRGVLHAEGNTFEWVLTPSSWDNVAGLTEPFCSPEMESYQWLEQKGNIKILISKMACW